MYHATQTELPRPMAPGDLVFGKQFNKLLNVLQQIVRMIPAARGEGEPLLNETIIWKITANGAQPGAYAADYYPLDGNTQTLSAKFKETDLGDESTNADVELWVPHDETIGSWTLPVGAIGVGKIVDFNPDTGDMIVLDCGNSVSFLPVGLVQDGGSNGSASVASTYTYSLKVLDKTGIATGSAFATAKTPTFARPLGLITAATFGLALFSAGTVTLIYAHEIPGSGAC